MVRISIVTVTRNNASGLDKTLASLARLHTVPTEIIIVDGLSTDGSDQVVASYESRLPITYMSEADDGIYHAMNKGLQRVSGDLIHYLNAGDSVYGEPYEGVTTPALLPVKLYGAGDKYLGFSSITIAGKSYCHQGIIFPTSHQPYDLRYPITADFSMILDVFPDLSQLQQADSGGVNYDLTGISSNKRFQRDKEIARILWDKKYVLLFAYFSITALSKRLIPENIRRSFHKKKSSKGRMV